MYMQHDQIYLRSSSADSTLLLLSLLHQTGTRGLYIYDTPLNDEHILSAGLEYLHFDNCNITDNGMKSLSNSTLS